MSEIFRMTLEHKDKEEEYRVFLMRKPNWVSPQFSPEKIAQIWGQAKQHDVLFSDYTRGDFQPFLLAMLHPASAWMEIELESKPVGLMYFTRITQGVDCLGHFTVWDGRAGGREPIFLRAIDWAFEEFNLHRMSAQVPVYQSGVRRFINRLGFVEEGLKREAVIYKGKWFPMQMFGLLRSDMEVNDE